jgi:hypothetical protein
VQKYLKMEIPYIKQKNKKGNRMCGPASMAMVLRSFNQNGFQNNLWKEIKEPDSHGSFYGKTHKMCLSFLNRGFYSVCLTVVNPILFLRLCQEHSVRVILGHRQSKRSELAHFTVFKEITNNMVIVNDSELGSNRGEKREIPHADFLELMGGNIEVPKNLCVLVSDSISSLNQSQCPTCSLPIIEMVNCGQCGNKVPLQPTVILGCQNSDCQDKAIETVICPHCDADFQLGND